MKITEEMKEAFYSKAEVTSRGTILHLDEAINAAIAASDGSPDAVDATRYRFLRNRVQPSPLPPKRCITVEVCDWSRNLDANASFNLWSSAELSGAALDAEIDKVLAAAPKDSL